eukprot:9468945-Pyramimonas_sp.AAC.1
MEDALGAATPWRSTKTRRVKWASPEARALGGEFMRIPLVAQDLVKSGKFKGGSLVKCPEGDDNCSASDVEVNYVHVRPIMGKYHSKVPSPYLIADGLMELDRELSGELLEIPGKGSTTRAEKVDMALAEGKNIKKLAAYVRCLARA